MHNLEFSVPFNNDLETLTEIFELKALNGNIIKEVYLSIPQEYAGSGRVTPRISSNQLITTIDRIHSKGIRVNMCMNSTCEGVDWYSPEIVIKTLKFLKQMHEEHGVEAVTIANPLYMIDVRKYLPNIEICASVLSDIDCVQRAELFVKAGANVIIPDVNINRNLKLLEEIKKFTNVELRLLVNEGCLYKCPYRKFHFNEISHNSLILQPESGVFFSNCHHVIRQDHSQILKSGWIRPEDTQKYSKITNQFKISGRTRPKNTVITTVEAYLEQSYGGNLLEILDSSINLFGIKSSAQLDNKSLEKYGFFDKVTACGMNCHECDHCQSLAGELIKVIVH